MILKIFSVYDDKACFFMNPFYCKTDAEAVRVFGYAVNDAQSSLSQMPNDVSLYRVGEFNDATASMVPCNPVCLSRGVEHLKVLSLRSEDTEVNDG